MIVVGIDPGKSGGAARLGDGPPRVAKIPATLHDLQRMLEVMLDGADHVFIEKVHSSPQMGVKSAFTFGQGYGQLEMACAYARVPLTRVTPRVWQRAMGCLSKGDKNVTKARAQELYPDIKMTHAIADALLIATYGIQTPV